MEWTNLLAPGASVASVFVANWLGRRSTLQVFERQTNAQIEAERRKAIAVRRTLAGALLGEVQGLLNMIKMRDLVSAYEQLLDRYIGGAGLKVPETPLARRGYTPVYNGTSSQIGTFPTSVTFQITSFYMLVRVLFDLMEDHNQITGIPSTNDHYKNSCLQIIAALEKLQKDGLALAAELEEIRRKPEVD